MAALQKTIGAFGTPHPLGLGWVVALPLCVAVFVALMAVVNFGGLWWIMTFTFFLVSTVHGLVRFAEALVRMAGTLIWRMAEYNKSAWAAIVLVATFALGVADFVLHYKS